MHWYWFQMLTMRFNLSSPDSTVYEPSRWSQYALSVANSASVASVVAKRARSALAPVFLTTPGDAHLSSSAFSRYPSTNVKLLDSPGASSTWRWCEAHGYHPDAMEFPALPACGTAASWKPFPYPR